MCTDLALETFSSYCPLVLRSQENFELLKSESWGNVSAVTQEEQTFGPWICINAVCARQLTCNSNLRKQRWGPGTSQLVRPLYQEASVWLKDTACLKKMRHWGRFLTSSFDLYTHENTQAWGKRKDKKNSVTSVCFVFESVNPIWYVNQF